MASPAVPQSARHPPSTTWVARSTVIVTGFVVWPSLRTSMLSQVGCTHGHGPAQFASTCRLTPSAGCSRTAT
ncbi:hypothetical protein HFP15_41545 [Amycolatopsis sp. K13G38]|uniref:Uncharacterized protein n=1 Tax=Amycolatopsis acididurans TaxID=2724524 RepID=A0ABX1JL01_9PSEU|nr:hypothetical protein [Amycolatopsis acididurans]